ERNSSIDIGIFCNEDANLERANKNKAFVNQIITYGLLFRSTFFITGLVGVIGVLIFYMKIIGYIVL
ncbi:MAG: hypothetical protein KAZ47_02895, partial [Streptococcus sp.]|nr:hypothetical protein [Streptococcus sp.]